MSSKSEICSKCGEQSLIKGELGLRTSRDLELIMVVRKDHGVEKKVPIKPSVCCKCGFVDLFVSNPSNLKICSTDKPIDPDFKQRPILSMIFKAGMGIASISRYPLSCFWFWVKMPMVC